MGLCGNCGEKCGFGGSILKKVQKVRKGPKNPRFYKLYISLKTLFIKMKKCFFCFTLYKSYFILGPFGPLDLFLDPLSLSLYSLLKKLEKIYII